MQALLLACLVVLLAGTQAQGEVNASMKVKDVNKDCPVNNALYTEDEFSVSKLFGLMTPMVSQGSRDSPCARAVPNLAECATDGSLQVREGCCSTACAGKMQQALVSSGRQCYREFIEVMCNSTELRESISGVLFGAAKRCMGLQPSCKLLSQPGDLLNATTTPANSSDSGHNSSKAANTPKQEREQQDGSSRHNPAPATNSTSSAGSSNSSTPQAAAANVGNSLGMSELAAALQAQADAPHMAPDRFMPLVPRPVETAASVIVLATPEEIEEATARNGTRSRIVSSDNSTPVNSSTPATGAASSPKPTAPQGAQGLAAPAAAAAMTPESAVPAPLAAGPASPSPSSASHHVYSSWGSVAAVLMVLLAVI